jgi:putative endonuclease
MIGYMYILECADGSYYTGSTRNLKKRLWEHDNFQGANYTRKKHPSKLIYCEEFPRIDEAFYREKQIQGWSRAKKKALIEKNPNSLHELAVCKNGSHCENVLLETGTSTPLSARSCDIRLLSLPLSGVEGEGETTMSKGTK